MDPQADSTSDRVRECVVARYGDLASPDYGFLDSGRLYVEYAGMLANLSNIAGVTMEDWTSFDYSAGFVLTFKAGGRWFRRGREVWGAWVSCVGPFALMANSPVERGAWERTDVVRQPEEGVGQSVSQVLSGYGFSLLGADDVEETVAGFRSWDGVEICSTFRVLFDEGDVPWWHLDTP